MLRLCAQAENVKRLLSAVLTAVLLVSMLGLFACGNDEKPPVTETTDPVTTAAPVTTEVPVTTVAPPTTAAPATTAVPETTAPPETQPVEVVMPYVNPLTGLPSAVDLSEKRPVAIMLNNLKVANPQIGIARADILYECLVEGGITRLMGVFSDYTGIESIGSVRSARDYYLDFAQNHDAIYICAGGSPQAYDELYARGIDFICGVNMYTPSTFHLDQNRVATMGSVHSLMTSGKGLTSGISYKKYRTTIKDGYTTPFLFDVESCSSNGGSEATHLILNYSAAQIVQMIYSANTNTYYRFQFGTAAHMDGETNEQLNFTNVLIMYATVNAIPGDTSGRLDVGTVGTGEGYYVSGGRSVPIKWEKTNGDAVIRLTTEDGKPLVMAPGKTFVSVLPTTAKATTQLNYRQS